MSWWIDPNGNCCVDIQPWRDAIGTMFIIHRYDGNRLTDGTHGDRRTNHVCHVIRDSDVLATWRPPDEEAALWRNVPLDTIIARTLELAKEAILASGF